MSFTYTNENTRYTTKSYTYKATITAYDPTTKIATLDTPVSLSLGTNTNVGDISSKYSMIGTQNNISDAILDGTGPATLSTDESGKFTAVFNVPAGVFQMGQRVFRVDNRIINYDPTSASMYAEGVFTAGGVFNKQSSPEYSPSIDSSTTSFVKTSQLSESVTQTLSVYTPRDPVAQSFLISADNYPNGAFLNSVKLFFAAKPSQDIPITLCIVGTMNGIPTGTVLDNSTVTLNANQVNTSTTPHYLDSSTYTEFMFDAPVYIKPGTLYAILVQSSSQDYTMCVARQNEFALPSTAKASPTDADPANPTKIGTIPYIGSLFESQNGQQWVPDPTADLMFVIDRCVFTTSVKTKNSIAFQLPKGLKTRKIIDDIQYYLDANTIPNQFDNTTVPIKSHEFNVTTTDFVPTGTTLNYTYQSLVYNGGSPTLSDAVSVTPGKYGCPTPDNISLDDGQGERYLDSNTTDSFTLYASMSSKDDAVSPIISDDGVSLFNIRYSINDMGIGNNVISLVNSGSNYNAQTTTVSISSPEYGSKPVLGVTITNGEVTSVYVVGDNTGSGYITTPTITISDGTGSGAEVLVSGETSPSGGNGFARYISKKVTLTPSNDSGDLRVFLTAYRPTKTNIFVYYKILNRNDTSNFDDNNWQLMTTVKNYGYFSSNKQDIVEYEYAPGIGNRANNSVSYVGGNGQTYNEFSQFAIKIVLASSDATVIPFVEDMRTIALPSGSGV